MTKPVSEPAVHDQQFHCLLAAMQEGFALFDCIADDHGGPVDFRCCTVNRSFELLTGIARDHATGRTIRELLPTLRESWLELCSRVARSGEPGELEDSLDDKGRYVRLKAYAPQPGQIALLFEDITSRKQAEQDAGQQHDQLQTLFEASQAGILMISPSGIITIVNERLAEMFATTRPELIGAYYPDLVHPDQRGFGSDLMRQILAREIDRVSTERHYCRADGTDFWGYISVRRNEDSQGNLISLVGHISDITERKLVELELLRSERKFRMLFDYSIDPCLIINDNTFVDCNQAAVAILGASSKADLLNTPPWQISPPFQPDGRSSREKALAHIASVDNVGYARFEWLHCRKDGTEFPVEVSLTKLEEHGQIYVVWRDISERKQAEAAIIKSEARYRSLVNNIPLGISLIDLDYRVVMTNNTQAAMFNLPAEWFTGKHCYEVFEKRAAICAHCPGTRCMATGQISECFTSGVRDDGSRFDVHLHTVPLLDDSGQPYGFIEVVEDISERILAEKALRESEERFKALSEAAFGGIIIHEKGQILECNQGLSEITGFSYEEHIGMNGLGLIAPESLDTVLTNIQNGYEESYEVTGIRKDGSRYPLAIRGKNVRYKERDVRVIEFRDITERKQSETALKTSEERFRSIMALSPDIISIISPTGELLYNSPAALRVHGYTEDDLVGLNTFTLIHPDDQAEVSRVFSQMLETPEQLHSVQYRYRNKDGSYLWMECAASNQLANPLLQGIIAISRNIDDRIRLETERFALEKQLLHTQKLESLGVLAGGIAHDFNNILMAIIGNADLALMRINKESPATENLHRIEQAAARAADLAKQMLAYSGKGKFVVENLDLNILLQEMLHMLEVSISKKAVLRLNPHHPLPLVEADATQMRQIIMNLVINASEAIGDKSGVIAITTGCMDCDRNYLKDVWLDENLSDGLYVYLEVADTGCGMDKETMARLFDPFFTTKFTGRGLGMAAVLGIVRGHKGAIKVYSEPGRGTTFKILLPASNRPVELFNGNAHSDGWQGSGTVLLVDDEETVRGIGSDMLKELGFHPLTACDGREALTVFKSRPDIDFVILDLTMPHMDGEQCFRELRLLKPDVKVIISSGYNEQEIAQKFAGKGLAGFIQKPYKLSTLKDVIKEVATAQTAAAS